MLLDLNDVLHQSGQVLSRQIHLNADDLAEVELAAPVTGQVRVQNARRNLVISGDADTQIWVACARCLKPFAHAMHVILEATVPLSLFQIPGQPAAAVEPGHNDNDLLDEEIRALFVDHNLDLSELLRQAIWLQMPIQPLCSENCTGLEEYARPRETMDPRLEELKRWNNHRH